MPSINDNFADAIEVVITSNGGTYTSSSLSNAGNTTEAGEPNTAHGGATAALSMWFKYPVANTGTATFDTQLSTAIASSTDTAMAIYTGTALNDLVLVASDDDGGGSGTSRIADLPVTAGTTYWIQIGGFGFATMNVVLRAVGPPSAGFTDPNATVTAVPATATAAALAPVVTGTSPSPTVNAVPATATARAVAPASVTGEKNLQGGGPATATAQAHAPTVTGTGPGTATVNAVPATATAQARTPTVTASASAPTLPMYYSNGVTWATATSTYVPPS